LIPDLIIENKPFYPHSAVQNKKSALKLDSIYFGKKIVPKLNFKVLAEKREKSYRIAEFIIHYLFENSDFVSGEKEEVLVGFSILELMNDIDADVSEEDIEEALLFLSK